MSGVRRTLPDPIVSAATAVEVTRLSERLENAERLTETLQRTMVALSGELDLEKLVQRITDEATAMTRAQFGAFFYNVTDERGERYLLYTLSGAPRESFDKFATPRNTELFGPTFAGKRPVRIDDVLVDPRYGKNPPFHGMPEGHLPVRSYLAVSVVSRSGAVLGGLFFGHAQPGIFTSRDERTVEIVASQAAVAIDNARLFAALRRAEEDARGARERVEAIFDQAPALITMMEGPEHRFAYVNRLYDQLLGERALLGKTVREAIPEITGEGYFEAIDRVYETGEPFTAAAMPATIARDGRPEQRYFDVVYRPYRDAQGKVLGVIGFGADVTGQVVAHRAQQQARAEAEVSAQHYRFLADAIPQLVWTTGPDGRPDYYNRRWFEYTGAPSSPEGADPWPELIHPEDRDRASAQWLESLRNGAPYDVQYRIRRRDGAYRWFLVRALALRDAHHNIVKWFGTCTDIDDQKRAEELQRLLADAGTVLVSSLDSQAMLAEVERLAVPLLADECAFELRPDVAPDTDASATAPSFTTESGQGFARMPLAVRGRSFGFMTLRSHPPRQLTPPDVAIGEELSRRVAIAIDNAKLVEVAEQERARATEANRLKDEFLGIVSHELRTPLTAILGWTRILRSKERDTPTFLRGLDILERNAKAQAQLVDDILDVSRIISGKLRLELRAVAAESVARSAIDVVRPTAEAKGVSLAVDIDPKVAAISGDADRLQQVVWNLVANGVKFTPRGGSVEVRVQNGEGQVEILVRDTGRGIDPKFLPHVFERFRQADSSSSRTHGGLGLGLSIVRHLVELHGGTVHAESDGVGFGSTFVVRLPARPDGHASIPPPPDARVSSPPSERPSVCELAGIEVLVCDDEEDMRELLRTALEDHGARVVVTSSAQEALTALRLHPPDVLLSDIGMPGEDGYALIQQVRALGSEGGGTPAIALTAYARPADAQRAFQAGFQLHLAKPVDTNTLARVVRDLARST
jgi:PAS domain S-box-containing protein